MRGRSTSWSIAGTERGDPRRFRAVVRRRAIDTRPTSLDCRSRTPPPIPTIAAHQYAYFRASTMLFPTASADIEPPSAANKRRHPPTDSCPTVRDLQAAIAALDGRSAGCAPAPDYAHDAAALALTRAAPTGWSRFRLQRHAPLLHDTPVRYERRASTTPMIGAGIARHMKPKHARRVRPESPGSLSSRCRTVPALSQPPRTHQRARRADPRQHMQHLLNYSARFEPTRHVAVRAMHTKIHAAVKFSDFLLPAVVVVERRTRRPRMHAACGPTWASGQHRRTLLPRTPGLRQTLRRAWSDTSESLRHSRTCTRQRATRSRGRLAKRCPGARDTSCAARLPRRERFSLVVLKTGAKSAGRRESDACERFRDGLHWAGSKPDPAVNSTTRAACRTSTRQAGFRLHVVREPTTYPLILPRNCAESPGSGSAARERLPTTRVGRWRRAHPAHYSLQPV
jgi:hypothetical protein